MTAQRRNALLVLALVLAAAWAGWRYWGAGDDGANAAAPTAAGTAKKAKDRVTADKVPVVVSGLSKPRTGEVFQRERNLFEFAQSPEELQAIEDARQAAAAARKKADEEAAQRAAEAARLAEERRKEDARRAAEEAARVAKLPPPPPPPPTPPSFPYQYVGTIGPVDDPFAVLSAPDRTYRYVKAGEIIDREFKLEFIAEARLDLSYTDKKFQDQFTQVQRFSEAAARTR